MWPSTDAIRHNTIIAPYLIVWVFDVEMVSLDLKDQS